VGGGLVKSTHRIDDDRINGRLYVELFGVVGDHNALLRSVLRTTTGISIILIVEPKCTLAACCPLLSHGEAAHGKDVTLHFMQDAAMTHNGRYTVYTSEMSNRSSVRETSSAIFHPDCLRGLLPAPFLLSLPVFVFSFSLFFVSVPCARLSWPYRQLLSARNFIYRIVSYRIVSYDVINSRFDVLSGGRWILKSKGELGRLGQFLSEDRSQNLPACQGSPQQCAHSVPDFIQIGSLSAEL